MRLEDLILVSVDDHVVEPPDLFEGRLPQKYADVAPQPRAQGQRHRRVAVHGRGAPEHRVERGRGPPARGVRDGPAVVRRHADRLLRHPRPREGHERERHCSARCASRASRSSAASCSPAPRRRTKPLAVALVQAYNDWHIESWCGAYPGRFIPLSLPMMWDVDKMAAEVRRVAEKGCFAVTFSENPVHLGYPSIHSGHWDKFFATCEELGTVVNVHIGSSSKMVITADDAPMDVLITLSPINIVQAAADFVWSNVAEEVPEAEVRAERGRHRLDSLLPRAHRLHVRPPPLLDRAGHAATACRARSWTSRSSAAGSTTRSASTCGTR